MVRAAASTSTTVLSLVGGFGWIDKDGNAGELQGTSARRISSRFPTSSVVKKLMPVISARPGEAGDKTELDRVLAGDEYDRYCCCCRLGRQGNVFTRRRDQCNLAANQIGRQLRKSIGLIFGKTVDDRHVLALGIAGLF